MKNKLFILSLLGLVLFVTACGNQNNSSSSESSSDSYISGSESSQSTISSNSSSSSISSETVSVKTQLKKYLQACFENQNYTIVDDELTRRYLPNAYYLEGEYETPIGYAEDETGIFSYQISNDIVNNISYLENAKGLYSYINGKDWKGDDDYLIESFALTNMDDIGNLVRDRTSTKVEAYTVNFSSLLCLVPNDVRQNYGSLIHEYNGKATLTLIEGGFNIALYSSFSFSTTNYNVINIGTTEIPEITTYFENGGKQVKNLASYISELLEINQYKIDYGNNKYRYFHPNYVVDLDGDSGEGFVKIESAYYLFTIESNTVTLGEEISGDIAYSYYFNKTFVNSFHLEEEKLVCDNYLTLAGMNSKYFTNEDLSENGYLASAIITADLAKDDQNELIYSECSITIISKTKVDSSAEEQVEKTYTATYSEFGIATYNVIDTYLNNI